MCWAISFPLKPSNVSGLTGKEWCSKFSLPTFLSTAFEHLGLVSMAGKSLLTDLYWDLWQQQLGVEMHSHIDLLVAVIRTLTQLEVRHSYPTGKILTQTYKYIAIKKKNLFTLCNTFPGKKSKTFTIDPWPVQGNLLKTFRETGLLAQDARSGPPHLEKTPGNPETGGRSLWVSSRPAARPACVLIRIRREISLEFREQ